MGLIKALTGAIGGGLADQWLEVLEPDNMGAQTVFTRGVTVRSGDSRSSNTKGTASTVSNGSIIHVYDNQFMMLVDGGKVVDYTAEPGYYKVDNSSLPSLFSGQLGASVKETFQRFKYGGVPSVSQKVFFINLQEIKGIKFGTRNPINYFDNFYNSELFLRAHGTYSIKIMDPIKFYQEVVPRNADKVEVNEINEQFLSEFLEALQSTINQMSTEGTRISYVASKSRELSKYMSTTLDEEWNQLRGMQIQAVGIASVSYDEESQKLINMRNQGAMLGDPSVREGYVQGAVARGMEAAGSNEGGAATAFMGMGMGMNAAGSMAGSFSQSNQAQMQRQSEAAQVQRQAEIEATQQVQTTNSWTCGLCGAASTGKFCAECGAKKPEGWRCVCGSENPEAAKFCVECGAKRKETERVCPGCGKKLDAEGKFCPECGAKLD